MEDLKKKAELAILVGLGEEYRDSGDEYRPDPLEELSQLAETAGAVVVDRITQARSQIDPRYYIGEGKARELLEKVTLHQATTVIFDNDLSPAQVKNHENLLGVKVIDRSGLILDIFALRARTREAKTQVELAQLKHLLPRLTRQWTHLSRQVGGIGVRGPGETQLEADRRRVRERIGSLSEVMKKIERRRDIARHGRRGKYTVTLVGYTNAGKSTLFNALSKASAPVENKLFKTLDSLTREMNLDTGDPALLSDTVGFIRDLPHELIASFRSTLAEVRDADLLLHVVDVTNPGWSHQRTVVEEVLRDIGAAEIPAIIVFNKTDRLPDSSTRDALSRRFPDAQFVSASRGNGIDELRAAITRTSLSSRIVRTVRINPDQGALLSELYRNGTVLDSRSEDGVLEITVVLDRSVAQRLGFLDSPTVSTTNTA